MKIICYKNESKSQLAVETAENDIYNLNFKTFQDLEKEAASSNIPISNFIKDYIKDKQPINQKAYQLNLLLPINPKEVWAAGVTYQTSRSARNHETTEERSEGASSFYDKVYDAERPELFIKSTNLRTVGPGGELYLRSDSNWLIPESELGLVINDKGKIVGYTIGNDMSCRDIEGENPLYLPQAKVWKNSCSIGPAILLAETVEDPYNLDILCRIYRKGELVFDQTANTSQLKRKYEELASYLVKDNDVFDGTVLLTGTSIVPPNEFSLQDGDLIEIEVPEIGILSNPVKSL